MLSWATQFSVCSFLDNNQYSSSHHSYDFLLAAGAHRYCAPTDQMLPAVQAFINASDDWIFGHFNYDVKNEIEALHSSHTDHVGFLDVYLFCPATVITGNASVISIGCLEQDPAFIFSEICSVPLHVPSETIPQATAIRPRVSRDIYLSVVEQLRRHILRGDCYEINYCIEFFDDKATIVPQQVYQQLTQVSPNPFSCYYTIDNKYLLCASPERYLRKAGTTLISQPIKGTIRRNHTSSEEDRQNIQLLQQSPKDRSENVMVVDLVRNDLSKVCTDGSVHVDELFGIYTFPQLHQMISTVSGELKAGCNFTDILKATFPMGSMTGAPKKKVMQLIEQYEAGRRGIFSGAVGYIAPNGDFDFNVVIRSIMYNAATHYLSYQVGSGITFYSNAAEEYEECMLKAKAIEQVLHNTV